MSPPPDDPTARLLEALSAVDLTSADGRAGLGVVLAEIERAAPGAILQRAAGIDLRRLGWPARPAGARSVPGRDPAARAALP